ncbi:unnamed protein product [Didymodactylos carnosus]|uniref:MOSC domain-containing protein n=1 Tax=Didymodactylos carnosus TaxID=1234261 RepID=A0A815AEU1_9BILA|nr:unnamed protein product [Didymodactylos carnosus]CAF1255845.1 unnamed protein product [Didymodactylos carnosus]CAF3923957.1 unnamed protein product [Didymodactylos carnosus]CAF4028195.1 unnamed protein product [Didymodactylos carnosus]
MANSSGVKDHILLTKLFIYPVKSCAGISLDKWHIDIHKSCLYLDREWTMIDRNGYALTQMRHPKMCKIIPKINLDKNQLVISAPNMISDLFIDLNEGANVKGDISDSLPLRLCGTDRWGYVYDQQVQQWLSKAMGTYANLARRCLKINYFNEGDFLLINEQSVQSIDSELPDEQITFDRFRPNFLFDHQQPYVEENWLQLQIGTCLFQSTGLCNRCVQVNVDQQSCSKQSQLFKKLKEYRQTNFGLMLKYVQTAVEIELLPQISVVKRGRRSVHWKFNGDCEYIDGPRIVFVCPCGGRLEPLRIHQAHDTEYLEIHYADGHTEIETGPISIYDDPLKIVSIEKKQMIKLDANEIIILYTQKKIDNTFAEKVLPDSSLRQIVKGPCMYAPKPNEWIHEFIWHGEQEEHKARIVPGAKVFKKLRLIPDQFYYNISDVRTSDDALITVKLMIFFELVDVETMLNNTHDPISDFINAICADVIAFASVRKYETFLENANQLNQLETYPQLMTRSESVGYKINKVVFRGYLATDKLQHMNDSAIESRTKLRLEDETERQLQLLEDMKLEKRYDRSQKERKMEMETIAHTLELAKQKHTAHLLEKEAENRVEREHQELLHNDEVKFYQNLKTMQVDLTQIIVAQNRNPDKLIQIVDDGNQKNKGIRSENIQFVEHL